VDNKLNILIVGAGEGGSRLISLFHSLESADILGVVDISTNAPGMKLARKLGIPTSDTWGSFINNDKLNKIIDVTGEEHVYRALEQEKNPGVNLMSGASAKTLWLLEEENERARLHALRKSKDWQEIFNSISDMIAVIDSQYRILTANKSFLKAFNVKLGEIKNRQCYEILDSRRSPWLVSSCKKTLKTKEKHVEEFFDPEQNKYLEVSIFPLIDETGKCNRVIYVARDVTEKKEIMDRMKRSEQRYRLLSENVVDFIWTMDMKLNFTFVSPSVEKLLGYSVKEALDLKLNKLLKPFSFGTAMKTFAEQLTLDRNVKDPKRSIYLELQNIHKDGSVIWLESTIRFIRDEKNRPTGIIGVSRDITSRKRTDEQLERQKEESEAANLEIKKLIKELEIKNESLTRTAQMKSDFVSHVSHELRTPLTAVKEGISIVCDESAGPLNAEQKDFLQTAESSINRLIRLINNILDLQKIETLLLEPVLNKEALQNYKRSI